MANLEERIKHEEELINRRLTWMLSFQGLLFTALSFATGDVKPKEAAEIQQVVGRKVLVVIPLVGMSTATLTLMGVAAAMLAIRQARRDRSVERTGEGWHVAEGLGSRGLPKFLGMFTALSFPAVAVLAWCYVAFG